MFRLRNFVTVITGAAVLLLTASAGSAFAQPKSSRMVTDDDLGLRKGSLLSEKQVTPEKGKYTNAAAGSAKKIPRSFANSPALIPHDIDGMLPITLKNNQCADCHMPEAAKQTGAVPVPRSHLMKLADGKDLHGKLDGERYNCVECHVRQSASPLPVRNTFKGGFKGSKDKTRSNLAETVNEGVSAK
jgi:cytochrome c-type protein NapB